jgi:hypothetical protein
MPGISTGGDEHSLIHFYAGWVGCCYTRMLRREWREVVQPAKRLKTRKTKKKGKLPKKKTKETPRKSIKTKKSKKKKQKTSIGM